MAWKKKALLSIFPNFGHHFIVNGSLDADDLFVGMKFVGRSSVKIEDIMRPSVCSHQSWRREEGSSFIAQLYGSSEGNQKRFW